MLLSQIRITTSREEGEKVEIRPEDVKLEAFLKHISSSGKPKFYFFSKLEVANIALSKMQEPCVVGNLRFYHHQPIFPPGSTRVIQQCKIKKTETNTYELKYTAKESGYHMLSIKLNGHQIHASPFKVRAHRTASSSSASATPSPLRHRKCPSVIVTNDGKVGGGGIGGPRRRQRHSTGSDYYATTGSTTSQINNEPLEDDLLYK